MGLDMYLNKRVYIGANYEHNDVTGSIKLTRGDTKLPIKLKRVVEITEQMGYWRKANAIHNWFVVNCQDGIDECQETYVHTEQLQELLDICSQVLKNHDLAHELLPPTSGFFFGGTKIDEYYFDDLKYTKKILKAALKENNGDYYYRSSW